MKNHSPIDAFAEPRIGTLFGRSGTCRALLDDCAGCYELGRCAIYWAFRAMAPQDATRVWMPSFHCGVEVQAALDARLPVDFYRIREDLSLDLDDLIRKLEQRPGPVLVIHYFGFAQPEIARLAEVCRRLGAPLVEDCAHALFSSYEGRALGTYGPLATFSIYKTIPMVGGGLLAVNREEYFTVTGRDFGSLPKPRDSRCSYRLYLKGRVRAVLGRRLTDWYRRIRYGEAAPEKEPMKRQLAADRAPYRVREIYPRGMARLSRWMARTVEVEEVVRRRRENYLQLDALLSGAPGYRKAFPDLHAGICPMFLPVRVARRGELAAKLRREAIETFVFGEFSHPLMEATQFPEAEGHRNQILCLPIHQQLSAEQIERLGITVSPLLAEHAVE